MRAVMYHGARDVRVEEIPDPRIGEPHQAVVRVWRAGLCGSDLHPYQDGRQTGAVAFGFGHEAVGTVVAVGAEVRKFHEGDRVLVFGSVSCGNCPPCLAREPMLCGQHMSPQIYGQGIPGLGGCQAEQLLVPVADHNLLAVPSAVSDDLGLLLTDNLPTSWLAARRGGVSEGDTVAVIGLGAVGVGAGLSAMAMGASRVIGLDLVGHRRAAAAALGIESVPAEDGAVVVLDLTKGLGVDVVVDAVGTSATTNLAFQVARKGGRVSVVGAAEQSAELAVILALAKNLDVAFGLCSIQREVPAVLDALDTGLLDEDAVTSLVSHRLPLAEAAEAYRLFDSRAEGVRKVVLQV
ncbi:alcohol dehydrogenase catalytic domain-containing protein [Streptomyces geranii]|uniref:alcohol dehydrogenase catalytic domain-containing protein n=1 Tax=Streptomyces geranii TaxID=2058923 RepID=UPI0018E51635|nr:alcohol dehydrogenase catalytic domain-containing protein [Streptomyces geranii]